MFKLRKGKTKVIALLYVLIPFFLIQILIWNYLTEYHHITGVVNWRPELILGLFILTWIFDSFAYIIGVNIGKNKIIPSISPKKSWEGFLGGMFVTVLLAYILSFNSSYIDYLISKHLLLFETENMGQNFLQSHFIQRYFQFGSIVIAFIVTFLATIGDFIESYYKRQAGVKDSGNLIPGHGGMLDRMDSFLISISILFLILFSVSKGFIA